MLLGLWSFGVLGADTVADPLVFGAVADAEPGSVVTSNSQTLSGIDADIPVRVTAGLYSINEGPFTAVNGTARNGDRVRVQQMAAAAFGASTTAKLGVGSPFTTYGFKVTTRKIDVTPDPVSFAPVKNAALGSVQTSAPATITGIEAPVAITVSGGSYSIDNGPFTTAAGSVSNNSQIRVRGLAADSPKQQTTVTINIGNIARDFKITTVAVVDTTPDDFSFPPALDVDPGTLQTSAPATIGGINGPAAISIAGGFYSINGEPYVDGAGTIRLGDTVTVQVLAAYSYGDTRTAAVTVGGVVGRYSVTTRSFVADSSVDPFQFQPLDNAVPGSVQLSPPVAITGINVQVPISIAGGRYSLNSGPFTSQSGMVVNGDTLVVEVQASSNPSTAATATVTIGSFSTGFTVTTAEASDPGPAAFSFVPVFNVAPGSAQVSHPVAVSDVPAGTSIAITGGRYSVNGAPFTTALGAVQNGDNVRVEVLASNAFATTTAATLSIRNGVASFLVRTRSADTTPDPFAFAPVNGAESGVSISSAAIIVSGIDAPAAVAITGGLYRVNGGAFSAASGVVVNGDAVSVQVLSDNTPATTTSATITIGGVGAAFMVATAAADTTPDPFSFTDDPAGFPLLASVSNPITVQGITRRSPPRSLAAPTASTAHRS